VFFGRRNKKEKSKTKNVIIEKQILFLEVNSGGFRVDLP
jgi:hypothetical protein